MTKKKVSKQMHSVGPNGKDLTKAFWRLTKDEHIGRELELWGSITSLEIQVRELKAREKDLLNVINNIDFHLDEFSAGFCRRPRKVKPAAVAEAVLNGMSTLRTLNAKLERRLRDATEDSR